MLKSWSECRCPFKLDFQRAFDSVSRDMLNVTEAMGFGTKWRTWISRCLSTSKLPVLINGSPTSLVFQVFWVSIKVIHHLSLFSSQCRCRFIQRVNDLNLMRIWMFFVLQSTKAALGIITTMNQALLFKWVWQFIDSDNAQWR